MLVVSKLRLRQLQTPTFKEIKLIKKLSTNISKDEIKRKSINLLITETFDAGLLGEHVLETLDHAFKNFLSKRCIIVPCRASVYISLIECQADRNMRVD